jgi:hypothetical protein
MCLIAWLLILRLGSSLYSSVVAQNVPGYPTASMFRTCFLYPGGWVLANLVLIGFAKQIPLVVRLTVFALQLPAAALFFFSTMGGV